MTDETPPQLLHRAVANALWTPLRRALQDGWPIVTDWANHDPRGNSHTSDYGPAGIPGPLPTYTPVNEVGRILGRLEPNDWPSRGLILTARLQEDDYGMIVAQLDPFTERVQWAAALVHSTARTPFLLDKNRHGTPTLRRNHDPQAHITPLVASILTTLAGLATVRLLTPEREAEHRADDNAHGIRAAEVFAIADRAGINPND